MADAIFISYRRDDSEGEAGRLFDDLTRAFGNDAVFMDVAGIKPGLDFRKAIEDNVTSCGVLLAVVGPQWATIAGADGKRRLDDSNDFVALEIASALRRDVPVIPVLVHDAKMPSADVLPESMKSFCYRNSVELSHARWNSDVRLLVEALKSYVQPGIVASLEPIHANVPVQLPAPHPPAASPLPVATKSNLPMMISFGVLAAIVIVAVIVYALRSSPSASPSSQSSLPAASPSPVSSMSQSPATAPSPSTAAAAPTTVTATTAPSTSPAAIKSSSVLQPAPGIIGTWKRTGGQGDSDALGMLVISGSGSNVVVHAYGKCQAPVCDWGQQQGVVDGQNIVATFSPKPSGSDTSRTAVITAHPVPGGLDVFIQNSFENPAGARKSFAHPIFAGAQ